MFSWDGYSEKRLSAGFGAMKSDQTHLSKVYKVDKGYASEKRSEATKG